MTPGGFILDEGARALGCTVFPAGTGNTDMQVEAAAALKPDVYCGTPDFLKVMLDRAAETGKDLSSIKRALVSGGALFPSLRAEYVSRGVSVLQCYATAEFGVIAYESAAADGAPNPGMIVNENLIVEIVRPGTGDPVAEGEVGEVVVTGFNPAYPLVRFGTGDLSAILPGPSPCGRTNIAHQGLDGPRRPAHQGQGHVRRSEAGRRDRAPAPGDRQGAAGRVARRRARRHDAACRAGGRTRARRWRDRGDAARRDQARRRGRRRRAPAACPTTARSSPTSATIPPEPRGAAGRAIFACIGKFRV